MKRGIAVLACLLAITAVTYLAIGKWGIRHETLDWFDAARQRPVAVDLAVRRDYEMKADAGYWKLPVAIISNGNTVRNTEYSFLSNFLAARGYLVASIQQDLPTDPPLVTKVGQPYVGRRAVYQRGEANILFVVEKLRKLQPNADYRHLTLVGHSNGGDVSVYCAKHHPELVSKVITLDNLRVPLVLSSRPKILSFRSSDPAFRTDPGVVPPAPEAKADGMDIVQTNFLHTWMSDRGPARVKQQIQAALDRFLTSDTASELAPVNTDRLIVSHAGDQRLAAGGKAVQASSVHP
jgi:dienelactone hydrolase